MTKIISLDFELASVLNLLDVGTHEWSLCKDTVPILCGFALDYDEPKVFTFDRLDGPFNTAPVGSKNALKLTEACEFNNQLLDAVASGAEIWAWNANFEWNIWNHICHPRFNWPKLPIERFHCTMATAACAGLPMTLEHAAEALNTHYRKDTASHNLMMRMARPRGFDDKGRPRWWHREDMNKLEQLAGYNYADVLTEREVHARIPKMTQRERQIWLVDQRMNARGLPIDKVLLGKLREITLSEQLRLNAEIKTATRGSVSGSSQNLKLLEWVQDRGYPHPTLEKDTLDAFVKSPDFMALSDENAKAVLLARHECAKLSTAKLLRMSNYSKTDGVIRNLVQYGGAVRTLRWAGRGPQIQNYPRPLIETVKEAVRAILDGLEPDGIRILFGRPLDVVSSCLRAVFKAYPGCRFVVCDYHAIEAIVIAWLADFQAMLDVFRFPDPDMDIYVFTARGVGSNNRKMGKVMRLGLNYGMGHVKFRETAALSGITLTLAEAKNAVDKFRQANGPIVSLWHACECQAIRALQNPGFTYKAGKVEFRMADPAKRLAGALLMTLPSGRNLVYRNARLEQGRIKFWGVDQYTGQWKELDTYGGKLVENATQAVARDLLADAIVVVEDLFPDTLRATIHDEIVAMTNADDADELFNVMKGVMSTPPAWAHGMPLSAAGGIVERYGKL